MSKATAPGDSGAAASSSSMVSGAPAGSRVERIARDHDRGPARLSLDDLRARLRPLASAEDEAAEESGRGDYDLNPDAARPPRTTLRAAAVLAPLILRPEGLTVLLTLRSAHLPSHAGQIAFPGGKLDPGDASLRDAALRETEEEVGLPRARIDLIGALDPYQTGTGFLIRPFVGLVTPPFTVTPEPGEVAEAFEAPLAFLMDPANHQRHSAVWNGRRRTYWAIPWEGRYIWGATAGMLRNLYERLSG